MPFIRWIEEGDATGDLGDFIQKWRAANLQRDKFPDILHCFSARPDVLKQISELSYSLHFSNGHLDRRTKEMIATLVSGINHCPY